MPVRLSLTIMPYCLSFLFLRTLDFLIRNAKSINVTSFSNDIFSCCPLFSPSLLILLPPTNVKNYGPVLTLSFRVKLLLPFLPLPPLLFLPLPFLTSSVTRLQNSSLSFFLFLLLLPLLILLLLLLLLHSSHSLLLLL